MTPQEIFNKVATHLFAQRQPAILNDDSERCVYLNEVTKEMCAVGCLLKTYNPAFEGHGVGRLIDNFPDQIPSYFKDNLELLLDLQAAHDYSGNWKSPDRLAKELAWIGCKHNLSDEILKPFFDLKFWNEVQ